MKCANCRLYVSRHDLKDAQKCLDILTKTLEDNLL